MAELLSPAPHTDATRISSASLDHFPKEERNLSLEVQISSLDLTLVSSWEIIQLVDWNGQQNFKQELGCAVSKEEADITASQGIEEPMNVSSLTNEDKDNGRKHAHLETSCTFGNINLDTKHFQTRECGLQPESKKIGLNLKDDLDITMEQKARGQPEYERMAAVQIVSEKGSPSAMLLQKIEIQNHELNVRMASMISALKSVSAAMPPCVTRGCGRTCNAPTGRHERCWVSCGTRAELEAEMGRGGSKPARQLAGVPRAACITPPRGAPLWGRLEKCRSAEALVGSRRVVKSLSYSAKATPISTLLLAESCNRRVCDRAKTGFHGRSSVHGDPFCARYERKGFADTR